LRLAIDTYERVAAIYPHPAKIRRANPAGWREVLAAEEQADLVARAYHAGEATIDAVNLALTDVERAYLYAESGMKTSRRVAQPSRRKT